MSNFDEQMEQAADSAIKTIARLEQTNIPALEAMVRFSKLLSTRLYFGDGAPDTREIKRRGPALAEGLEAYRAIAEDRELSPAAREAFDAVDENYYAFNLLAEQCVTGKSAYASVDTELRKAAAAAQQGYNRCKGTIFSFADSGVLLNYAYFQPHRANDTDGLRAGLADMIKAGKVSSDEPLRMTTLGERAADFAARTKLTLRSGLKQPDSGAAKQ